MRYLKIHIRSDYLVHADNQVLAGFKKFIR